MAMDLPTQDPVASESELDSIDFSSFNEPELDTTSPEQLANPDKIVPDFTKYSNPFTGNLEYLKDRYAISDGNLVAGIKATEISRQIELGQITEEEGRMRIMELDDPHLQQLGQQVNLLEEKLNPLDPLLFFGDALEFFPSMREATVGGLQGAAVGAASGAAYGFVAGNVLGGVGTPEELITVPGGASLGARWGFTIGSSAAVAKLEAGSSYRDLVVAGVDHRTAKNVSTAVGLTNGLLETLQLKGLGRVATKAFVNELGTTAGKARVKAVLLDLAKEYGEQITQEEAQEITSIIGEALAAQVSDTPEAMPTGQEIFDRLKETLIRTARGGVVAVGGSRVAGQSAGKAYNELRTVLTDPAREARRVEAELDVAMANRGAQALQTGRAGIADVIDVMRQAITGETTLSDLEEAKLQAMDNQQALDILYPESQQDATVQTIDGRPTLTAGVQQVVDLSALDIPQQDATAIPTTTLPTPELQGRLQQINSDLKIIDKEISRLEQDFTTRDTEGKPTTAVVNKLEKLYNLRDTRTVEQELLQENLLTPDELGQAKVPLKITANKLQALRNRAVQRIFQAFNKGVRTGTTITKANIKQVQKAVVSYIRSSDMPAADKGKFLSTIQQNQTPEQFAKALPKIQEKINAYIQKDQARRATKTMKRLLKQAKPKSQSGKPVGKFDADTQTLLDTYAKFIQGDKTSLSPASIAEDMYNTLLDKMDAGKTLTPVEEQQLEIADRFRKFEDMSLQDMLATIEDMKNIMATGKTAHQARKQQRAAERQAVRDTAVTSALGGRTLDKRPKTALQKKLDTARNMLATGQVGWNNYMNMISEFDPDHVLTTLMDTHEAKRTEAASVQAIQVALGDALADALDIATNPEDANLAQKQKTKALLEKFNKDRREVIEFQHITQNGTVETMYLENRMQLRKLAMEMKDPGLRDGFVEGNGYTFGIPESGSAGGAKTTEQAVYELLTPEDVALMNVQLAFYETYYERINQWYREKHGIDLPREELYSGQVKRKNLDKSIAESTLQDMKKRFSITPLSARARVKNANAIAAQNDIDVISQHIVGWEHAMAWDEAVVRINDVLSDPRFQEVVRTRYGEGFFGIVQKAFEDFIANRHQLYNAGIDGYNTLTKNIITAKLGAKGISQALKQLTSVTSYLDYVSPVELAAGFKDFTLHPGTAVETLMKESPILRTRWKSMSYEVAEVYRNNKDNFFGGGSALADVLMMATQVGDMAAVLPGSWAVYKAELAKTGSKEKAIRAAERATEETQQSNSLDQLSDWQRGNAFQKLFSLFKSSPNQFFRKELDAWRDAWNHWGNKEVRNRALRSIAVFHIINPVVFQFVATGFSLDDDDLWKYARAAILGSANGLFVFGELLEYATGLGVNMAANTFLGKEGKIDDDVFEPEFTVYRELAGDGKALADATMKLFAQDGDIDLLGTGGPKEDPVVDFVKAAAKFGDVFTGLPLDTLVSYAESGTAAVEAQDPWALALTLGGWPRSVVKDAIGEDKGTIDLLGTGSTQNTGARALEAFLGLGAGVLGGIVKNNAPEDQVGISDEEFQSWLLPEDVQDTPEDATMEQQSLFEDLGLTEDLPTDEGQ